jgi:tRNA nucleotidyltransferase (CCA-adding enzyme)
MTTPFIPVEPSLPIDEAISLAKDEHQDLLGYRREAGLFLVHRDDLAKMSAMGLEKMPVECICMPDTSPLLRSERTRLSTTDDYSRRLTSYFPVYFVAALYELQSLMQRMDMKGYVVGGIARDLLLFHEKRLQVKDVDVTVEGDALALARFLMENSRNFELVDEFPEFGTAKVRYKDSLMFDFASTRQEIYPHCGALPVLVKRGVPLVDDIVRRDFTINALAFSVHELGHVLDYSNGIRDIEARQIRVLHPVSFFEDPSRILRAFKFCARFDFQLAKETQHLLEQFLRWGGQCYKGGGERIKQELKGLFSVYESPVKSHWLEVFVAEQCYRLIDMDLPLNPASAPAPETMARLQGIAALLPVIQSTLSVYADPDFAFDTYLCFLFRDWPADAFQNAVKRLGLTKNERETVDAFRRLKETLRERFGGLHEFSSPAEIYDLFNGLPFITVVACLLELGFQNEKQMKAVLEAFLIYKRKWEKMQLELDGNDLIGLGVPEGKVIGHLLDRLLHAKLAGQIPERMDEIRYVRSHIESQTPPPIQELNQGPNAPTSQTPERVPTDDSDKPLPPDVQADAERTPHVAPPQP